MSESAPETPHDGPDCCGAGKACESKSTETVRTATTTTTSDSSPTITAQAKSTHSRKPASNANAAASSSGERQAKPQRPNKQAGGGGKNAPKPTPKILTYGDLPEGLYIDIGANLVCEPYNGVYFGRKKHEPDLDSVITRSKNAGLTHLMLTSCTLSDTKESLAIVQQNPGYMFTTVGFHPLRTAEMAQADAEGKLDSLMDEMLDIATKGKADGTIVAIGECGLDYNEDRLKFASKEIQQRYFPLHFKLTKATGLPLFLHNRDSTEDFMAILEKHQDDFTTGCVHSFDAGEEALKRILAFPKKLYIGLNGCSIRREDGFETMKKIPLDRILIETDCPYCEVKSSHVGHNLVKTRWPQVDPGKYQDVKEEIDHPYFATVGKGGKYASLEELEKAMAIRQTRPLPQVVSGRVEPCHIIQVLEIICQARGLDYVETAKQFYRNTLECFFPHRLDSESASTSTSTTTSSTSTSTSSAPPSSTASS